MDNNFCNLLFFSVALEEYDVLDFASDFLAGVRANYFNSKCETQSDRSVQLVGGDEYSFVYNIRKGSPLSFKSYKNGSLLQSSEPTADGYLVNTYSNNKLYKKLYFNKEHIWVRSVYINGKNPYSTENTEIKPVYINNRLLIEKKTFNGDCAVTSYLYPKSSMPDDADYSALAFTNDGFVYFNSVPNRELVSKTVYHDMGVDNIGGFNFGEVDFNLSRNMNSTFDITSAEYLTAENGNPNNKNTNFSINEDAPASYADDFAQEITGEKITFPDDEETPDKIIDSCSEEYRYFGAVDESSGRSGYGRTVTSLGKTAYEGEYLNDMRNGFGTFYYKNGAINYVGNWEKNVRNGFGVGFRNSDKTAHIGRWSNNIPDGIGARFDSDGNFLFLGNYVDGKKQGIGITIDENNNFIVSDFKDDEVISSHLLEN